MRFVLRLLIYLWTFPTTAVGLALLIPALLTGGRARIVDGVLEIHGGIVRILLRDGISRLMTLFTRDATLARGGASALTLGHVVLGQDEERLDWSRPHERIHVRQAERWGPFFIPAYLIASLITWFHGGRPYLDNPFEREAYSASSD